MTKFIEHCYKCNSPVICECPNCDTKDTVIVGLLEALAEIAKNEGAFSRDQLTHARNTIENINSIVDAAIKAADPGAQAIPTSE